MRGVQHRGAGGGPAAAGPQRGDRVDGGPGAAGRHGGPDGRSADDGLRLFGHEPGLPSRAATRRRRVRARGLRRRVLHRVRGHRAGCVAPAAADREEGRQEVARRAGRSGRGGRLCLRARHPLSVPYHHHHHHHHQHYHRPPTPPALPPPPHPDTPLLPPPPLRPLGLPRTSHPHHSLRLRPAPLRSHHLPLDVHRRRAALPPAHHPLLRRPARRLPRRPPRAALPRLRGLRVRLPAAAAAAPRHGQHGAAESAAVRAAGARGRGARHRDGAAHGGGDVRG